MIAGRVLLSLIFLTSGVGKILDWEGTAQYMSSEGMGTVSLFLVLAIAVEILGGLSILTGIWTRIGALALFLFLIAVTLIFHDFWTYEGMERQTQMINVMKNLAIMGGLLLLVGFGPGKVSVANRLREKKES